MLRFLSRTLPRELVTPQALHSLALCLSRGSGSAAANSVVQPFSSISALSLPEQQRLSAQCLPLQPLQACNGDPSISVASKIAQWMRCCLRLPRRGRFCLN